MPRNTGEKTESMSVNVRHTGDSPAEVNTAKHSEGFSREGSVAQVTHQKELLT